MGKPHMELVNIDMEKGWKTPPGYPAGIEQKILASDLDEEKKTGSRTRLLRFDPGAFSTEPFVHDYFEEVYVMSGDLIVKDRACDPHTYAYRPPHTPHGPFRSNTDAFYWNCIIISKGYQGIGILILYNFL